MRRILNVSIAHLLGFCLVSALSFRWFVKTAVSGPEPFTKKLMSLTNLKKENTDYCGYEAEEYISPVKDTQVIGLYQGNPQLPVISGKENNSWYIDQYDALLGATSRIVSGINFKGTLLSRTYQPIYNIIAYPDCNEKECNLVTWSVVDSHPVAKISAIDANGVVLNSIDHLFFDSETGIVSYTTKSTDISSRIVLNYEGKLLQSIDETPGINRSLGFLGYMPETTQILYADYQTGMRMIYKLDEISLKRVMCQK